MIKILDTTLREGEQTPGVYFDIHIKVAIAELLSKIGIDIIEAGHPVVSDSIYKAVKSISKNNHNNSIIAAHARSLKYDIDKALESDVNLIGIFYSITDERLETVFKTDIREATKKICNVIEYSKSKDDSIIIRYTPEDTVRSKFSNISFAAIEAVKSGADIISIADTTGFMIPGTKNSYFDYISRLRDCFAKHDVHPLIAIHCHNDRGLALANAVDAIRAGVDIIDASVLGLGERAGIIDLAQLISLLSIDLDVSKKYKTELLPELYKLISDYSGVKIAINMPIVGENAFMHCAGLHTHAAAFDPIHYQSLSPKYFNKRMNISLDHMSGLSSVKYALEQLQIEEARIDVLKYLLNEIKLIGEKSRAVSLSELKYLYNYIISED